MKRILVSRTDAIGDLILTLPVARAIKAVSPQCEVVMLVSEYTQPLLAEEHYLDGVIAIPGRGCRNANELRQLVLRLEAECFDAVIAVYPRLSLALAFALAGIPRRVGTSRRGYSWLYSNRVTLHRRDSGVHELELNLRLSQALIPNLESCEPSLTVSAAEISSARELLAANGVAADERFVIVHPFSRGSAPNWTATEYRELVRRLSAAGITVVVTGSPEETKSVDALLLEVGAKVHNFAGMCGLAQLKAVIKLAELIVCGSTGPIHIAAAVGTYAVGLYPAESALSARRWGPRGEANKLFQATVTSVDAKTGIERLGIAVDAVYESVVQRLRLDRKHSNHHLE